MWAVQLVLRGREFGFPLHLGWWEPIGGGVALALHGVQSDTVVKVIQHIGFWWHASCVLIFLNILPVLQAFSRAYGYSKRFRL